VGAVAASLGRSQSRKTPLLYGGRLFIAALDMFLLASIPADQVQELDDRFRAAGIPLYFEPDYSRRRHDVLPTGSLYSTEASVPDWCLAHVCLEEQAEEAKRLFDDPTYKVKAPIDVQKFEAKMAKLGADAGLAWRVPDATLNWIVSGAIAAVVIGLAIFAITSS